MRRFDGCMWFVSHLALDHSADPEYSHAVIAKLVYADGTPAPQLWDLGRALDASHDGCSLELLGFDSPAGREVFWHSSAHVLGQALEALHGDDVLLCDGPALEEGGFFYEMWLAGDERVAEADYKGIEKLVKKFVKKRQSFQRLEVTREFARTMFADNRFKLEMLDRIPAGEAVTLYRCGDFVDLCRGPHLPHSGLLKGFTMYVTIACADHQWWYPYRVWLPRVRAYVSYRSSGSHWRSRGAKEGGAEADSTSTDGELLQRAYGTSFPTKQELAEWQARMEEARQRDHRLIGKQQGLFFFHELSPGSAFMLPHGTIIYNRLVDMLRKEYRARGYSEVRCREHRARLGASDSNGCVLLAGDDPAHLQAAAVGDFWPPGQLQ